MTGQTGLLSMGKSVLLPVKLISEDDLLVTAVFPNIVLVPRLVKDGGGGVALLGLAIPPSRRRPLTVRDP